MIVSRVLRSLFPPGSAWRLPSCLGLLVDGIADSLEDIKTFVSGVLTEAIPLTAVDMLPEWYEALGLKYDGNEPLETRQNRVHAALTAIGDQSLGYIEDQINKEFPDVYLEEYVPAGGDTIYRYYVLGEVPTTKNYIRLKSIIQRIAPLHLEPTYDVDILSDTDLARCGLATCGVARTGNSE